MVVRLIEVGEGASGTVLVISVDGGTRSGKVVVDTVDGSSRSVEVIVGKVVEVAPAGAPVPKVVVASAPLPGRNNRLYECAVDRSLGSYDSFPLETTSTGPRSARKAPPCEGAS